MLISIMASERVILTSSSSSSMLRSDPAKRGVDHGVSAFVLTFEFSAGDEKRNRILLSGTRTQTTVLHNNIYVSINAT